MPVKIRLARHGKKGKAFFHIVVADTRAPRDGRFIEKIGTYNPNTNPATIILDTDKAYEWMNKGAVPTDTARAILSYKGVLYKKHLAEGVKKGALTQDKADGIFSEWSARKQNKIDSKRSSVLTNKEESEKARLSAEAKVNEAREKALNAKLAAATATAEAATAAESEAPANTESEDQSAPAAETQE